MQYELLQLVCINVWGNAHIKGAVRLGNGEFYPTNSCFLYCREVLISTPSSFHPDGDRKDINPESWIIEMKRNGVSRLQVRLGSSDERLIEDRHAAAFCGGGGSRRIEAIGKGAVHAWSPRWTLSDRDDPEERIWKVAYLMTSTSPRRSGPDPSSVKDALQSNLGEIEAFARGQKLFNFAYCFRSALEALESDDPIALSYSPDIVPPGFLGVEARRILVAAQKAWVFGGMGSWNDLGFEGEDQKRYDCLSRELYALCNLALMAAANSE